jgi:hypothetical protein
MNDERDELVRLLPDPARFELPEHRRQLLRERFMQQIEETPVLPVAPAGPPGRPRRRLVLAMSAAMALVVVVAGAVSSLGFGVGRFWADRTAAGALLERIALVAGDSTAIPPADQIRDDQFAFVETYGGYGGLTRYTDEHNNAWTEAQPLNLHRRLIWTSVDGTRPGLLRDHVATPPEDLPLDPNTDPYLNGPTFRYLTTLPTNPDVLLAKIYLETFGAGANPQQEAFVTIGDLMRESIVPPDLAQALYRAAARIPGVMVVDDAVDALGRHGVAVAREHDGARSEWIFDRTTLEFMGEREVTTEASEFMAPGTVISTTAVVVRAIVDEAGQLPPR